MSAPQDIKHGSPSERLIVLDDDLEECRQGTGKKPILISSYAGGVQGMTFLKKDKQTMTARTAPPGDPQEIFRDLVRTAEQHMHLRETLIVDLRSICGKYKQLVAAETALEKLS
jgi:hypothetical protein